MNKQDSIYLMTKQTSILQTDKDALSCYGLAKMYVIRESENRS